MKVMIETSETGTGWRLTFLRDPSLSDLSACIRVLNEAAVELHEEYVTEAGTGATPLRLFQRNPDGSMMKTGLPASPEADNDLHGRKRR